jgi:hypothetical protein
MHFHGAPAVYVCHGWSPWQEAPPVFPRILHYIAVDDTCRDRLVYEHGIPEERIRALYSFVDMVRFQRRSPLPEKPRRALLFSNYARRGTHLEPVSEACRRAGIRLDTAGTGTGNPTPHPEKILEAYDLVFAKGRCALEALAVGAAVIVCDAKGLGPMVTSGEFPELRRYNFGIRAMSRPVTPEAILEEIRRYSPVDAAEVTRLVRSSASMEDAVDQLLDIYHEVVEISERQEVSAAVEARMLAQYLRRLSVDISRELGRPRARRRRKSRKFRRILRQLSGVRRSR